MQCDYVYCSDILYYYYVFNSDNIYNLFGYKIQLNFLYFVFLFVCIFF